MRRLRSIGSLIVGAALGLSSGSCSHGGGGKGSSKQVTGPPSPSLSLADVSMGEGGANAAQASFTVTLSSPATTAVTVDYSTRDGTAIAGTDYKQTSGQIAFAVGESEKTVVIDILQDDLDEDDETFSLALENAVNASLERAEATVTIEDDDPTPLVSIRDAAITEEKGARATFVVDLSPASGRQVTVTYETQNGTAKAGSDFVAASGTLTFAPGDTRESIKVTIIDDDREEPEETFHVRLTGAVNAELGDAQATGKIADDDRPVSGLDDRPVDDGCVLLEPPPAPGEVQIVRAFPRLSLNALTLVQRRGEPSRWFALDRTGRVLGFANDPAVKRASTVLDIRDRVDDRGEGGLLGMAFPPDAHARDEAYIFYTTRGSPLTICISRFSSKDGGVTLERPSEVPLMRIPKSSSNHNGGHLAFGPDGYLYIGIGDDQQLFQPQDILTIPGKILRVDVRGGFPFGIPDDNPFAGGGGRPEIYSWGFRNPWQWSFDRAGGDLWVGDVGERSWEEVDRVERGGNYGWPIREGAHCFGTATCNSSGLTDPVVEHSHQDGARAVIGGYVYRGQKLQGLQGTYIYGDWGSRRIWGFQPASPGTAPRVLADLGKGENILSFAEDDEGELLVVAGGAKIYRIAPDADPGGSSFPRKLSSVPCLDPRDPRVPGPGLVPYDVNAPSWSDGAEMQRWFALPSGKTIHVAESGDWELPEGAVLIQDLRLGQKLVETRLLVRHGDGDWAGYSYEWNDEQTDAELLDGEKTKEVGGQTWVFPGRGQCLQCHSEAAGRVLGLEDSQMNRPFTYAQTGRTANQLTTFDHIGLFEKALPKPVDGFPSLADPYDADEPVEARARSYLHVNCSPCHRPGGTARGESDFRSQASLEDMHICNAAPVEKDPSAPDARLLVPGDPSRSLISIRMRAQDAARRMPPVATRRVDDVGAELIDAWIRSIRKCP